MRVLQGPGRPQRHLLPHTGGAEQGPRHRIQREPRPRSRLRREPLRHPPGQDLRPRERRPRQGEEDPSLGPRPRPPRPRLPGGLRGVPEIHPGTWHDIHPQPRRSQGHRGAGHHRPRDHGGPPRRRRRHSPRGRGRPHLRHLHCREDHLRRDQDVRRRAHRSPGSLQIPPRGQVLRDPGRRRERRGRPPRGLRAPPLRDLQAHHGRHLPRRRR